VSTNHVYNALDAIKIELPATIGWKITIQIIPQSLVTRFKSMVSISFTPKGLIDSYRLGIKSFHASENIFVCFIIILGTKLGE
jgi:hypothetical protein